MKEHPANVCAVHRGMFSVHWGISLSTLGVFSTPGGYPEYTGGCSVHRGNNISTSEGYHDECGGLFNTPGFPHKCNVFPMTFPHIYHDIPPCTHDIPFRCTQHPPVYCKAPLYCTDIMQGVKLSVSFSSLIFTT